jgi:hypothetical protein
MWPSSTVARSQGSLKIAWPKLYFYKLGSRGERERGGKKKAKEKKAVSIFMRPAPNGSIF